MEKASVSEAVGSYRSTEDTSVNSTIGDFRQFPEVLAAMDQIRLQPSLPQVPRPIFPFSSALEVQQLPPQEILSRVQDYISAFDYNYLALPFFQLKRSERMEYVINNARQIISTSWPIQCVEAVFIGIYLTLQATSIIRFALFLLLNLVLLYTQMHY